MNASYFMLFWALAGSVPVAHGTGCGDSSRETSTGGTATACCCSWRLGVLRGTWQLVDYGELSEE